MGTKYSVDPTELAAVAKEASKFLKAIANPDRLQILCMLVQEEMNVSSLEAVTGIRQPRLSQHLARLRQEGLVANRRDAKEIRYSLSSREAQEVIALLHQLYCAPK
jgi:ArsR family transcriptional regulator|tara:strand:- start:446 stop:763 length:318 start_codon:yes stop_codon:yes gene_type:complete